MSNPIVTDPDILRASPEHLGRLLDEYRRLQKVETALVEQCMLTEAVEYDGKPAAQVIHDLIDWHLQSYQGLTEWLKDTADQITFEAKENTRRLVGRDTA